MREKHGIPIFRFLSYVFAFIMPAYHSYKAILSDDVDYEIVWLRYWIFFGVFQVLECLFAKIVPYWYEMKCIFLIAVQWNGASIANILYLKVLHPALKLIEPSVDQFIEQSKQTTRAIREHANEAYLHQIEDI